MDDMNKINILVVGDMMLDKYVVGSVKRISPEAPVPVVEVNDEYMKLGGCGNVARNIKSFGANVDCLYAIGADTNGSIVGNLLDSAGIGDFSFFGLRNTIVKERIISDHRQVQMLRIDRESKEVVDPNLPIDIFVRMAKKKYDCIVVSDYDKGMITSELMSFLKHEGVAIIVDPKPNHAYMYNDVYMITPNDKEWGEMQINSGYQPVVQYTLVTHGKEGMTLMKTTDRKETWEIKGEPVEVFNVSGAGDTVVAAMAVHICSGIPIVAAARIANKCGAYVVTKPGTSVVPQNKYIQILEELF